MKILIAEDDLVSRKLLRTMLSKWGYEVIETRNGSEAWEAFQSDEAPALAILDWMMPKMDGAEVCRRIRQTPKLQHTHIILLTAKGQSEDIVEGLRAGANDYITKPFNPEELLARVQVGQRVVNLQSELAQRVKQLEEALSQVKQLQGFLPICSYCKKIRDDDNYWQGVEDYIENHSEALFTHSVCPECREKYVAELEELRNQKQEDNEEQIT